MRNGKARVWIGQPERGAGGAPACRQAGRRNEARTGPQRISSSLMPEPVKNIWDSDPVAFPEKAISPVP